MGLLSYGLLWRVGLVIVGVLWCREILGRWREDYGELKLADTARRGVIVGLWVVTLVIAGLMAQFIWGIVAMAMHAWGHPMG